MNLIWGWIKKGYLRIIGPIGDWLVRHRIHPNTITTIGTFCTIVGGVIYATGHIRTAGWWLGLTAFFDVLDGTVARRTGRSSTFGAFYDSALDRVADGAVLGGLIVFYGSSARYGSTVMQVVTLLGLVGAYMTSYTRARAEALGIDAKVGVLQRPERVTLLSAPQAFFGLALNGWILAGIIVLLTVTAWITVVQRFIAVHAASRPTDPQPQHAADLPPRAEATVAEPAPPQALPRHVTS
jgi:CDP-diacylglycerol--glycerol-3-phosphate 3-phosphatidyltransferase